MANLSFHQHKVWPGSLTSTKIGHFAQILAYFEKSETSNLFSPIILVGGLVGWLTK